MGTELSIETNAKKIQTLTKVAKLLRDKIQEQNKKIDSLQVEIIKIKEQLEKISRANIPPSTITKESTISVTTSTTQDKDFQKEFQVTGMEKAPALSLSEKSTDDKDQLMKALKVIDDL